MCNSFTPTVLLWESSFACTPHVKVGLTFCSGPTRSLSPHPGQALYSNSPPPSTALSSTLARPREPPIRVALSASAMCSLTASLASCLWLALLPSAVTLTVLMFASPPLLPSFLLPLQVLRSFSCPWSAEVCAAAASGGRLEALRYLHEHGCPWDSTTITAASHEGYDEIAQYALENGCPRT